MSASETLAAVFQVSPPNYPAYAGGPYDLAEAAVAAAAQWQVEPAKMNGAWILQTSTIAIPFR